MKVVKNVIVFADRLKSSFMTIPS